MEHLYQDFRYGIRALRKSPGFAAVTIAVLALGIGANTAIFSVVNAVLLKPLPFPEADRIVAIPHTPPQDIFPGRKYFSVSPANYYDWKAQNDVFSQMAMRRRRNRLGDRVGRACFAPGVLRVGRVLRGDGRPPAPRPTPRRRRRRARPRRGRHLGGALEEPVRQHPAIEGTTADHRRQEPHDRRRPAGQAGLSGGHEPLAAPRFHAGGPAPSAPSTTSASSPG